MAFDGLLLISGSQVPSGAAAAVVPEVSDDVDCVAVAALSAYCKDPAAARGAPPATRLLAHLAQSMTSTSRQYQRNYQPRFCIRGRNVNAKASPALRRSLDDACLALASSSSSAGNSGRGWPLRGEQTLIRAAPATALRAADEAVPEPLNLPAISLEGPGFSHRLRSRSYYLAGDLTAAELEGMTVAAADAESRVFTGLAWAEPDELGDGSSQTTATTTATTAATATAARKRAKKKPAERISPMSLSLKGDVSELRIEVKKNKMAAAATVGAATAAEKAAAVKRTDVDRLPFASIDSYLGLGRRERRQQRQPGGGGGGGALYHSAISISCRKLSRSGDLDDRVDMLIQIKPVRGT